jgi:phosphosulfolactate synthase (CoM biosynthesis protein A)
VPGVGFDIIEISCGFITIPAGDWLRLVEKVRKAGLKPINQSRKWGIQFGAGGATRSEDPEASGTRDQERPIVAARRFPDTGEYLIMIESEGITAT